MSELTPLQQIQQAHVWLMRDPKYCAYSGMFMLGEVEISDRVPTAGTDGLNVVYNPDYITTLTPPELRGLVMHENMHKALRHLTTWRHIYKINPRLANLACDYVINLMIIDLDGGRYEVTLPEGGAIDRQFAGMDSGQVFKILKESGNPTQQTLDVHDWEGAQELGERISKDIDQALRQGQLLSKRMGGGDSLTITNLLAPQVDWREALSQFVQETCSGEGYSSWRRPNRKWVSRGVYMPSQQADQISSLVVAIDTSGSIDTQMLSKFLSELRAISETADVQNVDLLYWGSSVVTHETYAKDSLSTILQSTHPKGGGGTDAQCIPNYLRDKHIDPACVLIFTDGYVADGWGEYTAPVLVVCTTDVVAPIGKTVKIR